MKKFRYAFPISAYVIYGLLLCVSLFSVIIAAFRLGEVGGLFSVFPVSDILSIVVFSLAFVSILWLIFFSNYVFSNDSFEVTRLFYKKRIRKADLIKLVTDKESGVSALYYYGAKEGEASISFIVISISKKKRADFEEALRSFKSDIILETRPKISEE